MKNTPRAHYAPRTCEMQQLRRDYVYVVQNGLTKVIAIYQLTIQEERQTKQDYIISRSVSNIKGIIISMAVYLSLWLNVT